MSEPPSAVGRRSRGGRSASHNSGDGVPTPSHGTSVPGTDLFTLIRGYPPVLGAMLLVDGVLTVILGGDATVSLGEVVAYLLLPPLAMYLLTQLTGGRRPGAVTIGVGVAGAAVLFAALFLLGDVHLLTLPGWLLALFGVILLGVAVFLMRRAAPAREEPPVPPLLNQSERATFTDPDSSSDSSRDFSSSSDFGSSGDPRDFGSSGGSRDFGDSRDDYGARPDASPATYGTSATDYGTPSGYDRPSDSDWPPPRRDNEPTPQSIDDTVQGLPRVPADPAAGPPEPDWPPRRDPTVTRPSWTDRDDAQPNWSAGNATPYTSAASDATPYAAANDAPPYASAGEATPYASAGEAAPYSAANDATPYASAGEAAPYSAANDAAPYASAGDGDARYGGAGYGAGSGSTRSDGTSDREWPPSPTNPDWPPRRDPEPAGSQRSWFDSDAEPAAGHPSGAYPSDAYPSDAYPSDAQARPFESQPYAAQPFDAQPSEARPTDAQSFGAQPYGARPSEDQPTDAPGGEPAEPSWQPGPPDREWPPADRTYPSGGRRSRHPDQ